MELHPLRYLLAAIAVAFTSLAPVGAPCATIWPTDTVPLVVDAGPDDSVELGIRFWADTDGYVSGIRFFKAVGNSGPHVGNLWDDSGTLLATAPFVHESPSGWQQVDFPTPVPVSANTLYVASYHTSNGHYSYGVEYFATKGVDAPPLHVPRDGEGGANGLFAYGSVSTFPGKAWKSSNYWVDVVFTPTPPPSSTLLSITVMPADVTLALGFSQQFSATGHYSDGSTRDLTREVVWSPSDSGVLAISGAGLATGKSAGSSTLYASVNELKAAASVEVRPFYSLLGNSAVPVVADSGPDAEVEVGVKFTADAPGYVFGIRFYKGAGNVGPHDVHLFSGSGTLLATATSSNETSSGWQEILFPAAVAINANEVYVASYHTTTGHYSCDQTYLSAKGIDTPPLHAPVDGTYGPNGVYAYGPSGVFPDAGWNASNYWVDVVFGAGTYPMDTIAPIVTSFSVAPVSATLTVPILGFAAQDNVAVSGYLINESALTPALSDPAWATTPPSSYRLTSGGAKTLYAWAKDAAGNVSRSGSAGVTVTIASAGPEPQGWYAGDMHVHRSCGDVPEPVSALFQKMNDHNLSVVSLLADMGNGEVLDAVTDLPLVNGADAGFSTANRILRWDAEWHWDPTFTRFAHNALGGHVVSLGLSQAQQMLAEYTYPIFQWAHSQKAIAGFAHMEYLDDKIPQELTCCTPMEYPVEVALGATDFISEDVTETGFANSSLSADAPILAYYRLLNCGFRPGLAAGTDYPCNTVSAPGALLTYALIKEGELSYNNFIKAIAAGRTVVSRNGHREFLDMTVNGNATPGDEVRLSGRGSVQVDIRWTAAQTFLGSVELVKNGVVVASRQAAAGPTAPALWSTSVDFDRSGWLAARRMGADGHQVHTAAVFVVVDGAPVRTSSADAHFYVQWMDNLLKKTSVGGAWNWLFSNDLQAAQGRYRQAQGLYQQVELEALAAEAGGNTIFSTQLPNVFENDAFYELGTRFWSDVPGRITQVRTFLGVSEGGAHEVRIWRAGDSALMAGPFTWNVSPGPAGWKSFALPVPVSIDAETDYIVAISNSGDRIYPSAPGGFDAPLVNGHLHTYSGSGVYSETPGTMPTLTWSNSNYFRDVVFQP